MNELRVFKDGDLTYGVRAGLFAFGDLVVSYAGADAQGLANDDTNYIYLESDGTRVDNTTGFPVPSVTPHIPLATIATGTASVAAVTSKYDQIDIVDYRGRVLYTPNDGSTGETVSIAVGAESSDARIFTVQAVDLAGNSLSGRRQIMARIADSDFGTNAPGGLLSITATKTLGTHLAGQVVLGETDATGELQVTVNITTSTTNYFMASVFGGPTVSTGGVAWD